MDGHAVIVLRETKTGKRLNVVESVTVECSITCNMLRRLCQDKLPGDRLLAESTAAYRKQFKKALKVLYLDEGRHSPYSLRRGGATHDFRSHGRIGNILIRGKWASTRSARIYITEGLASLAQLETTSTQARLMKVASRLLRPAGEGWARSPSPGLGFLEAVDGRERPSGGRAGIAPRGRAPT